MLKKLSNWLGKGREKSSFINQASSAAQIADEIRARPSKTEAPVAAPAHPSPPEWAPELPPRRTVIQAPVIVEAPAPADDKSICIKAQPSADGESCKFMVNRPLFSGHSWFFPSFESAAGSALAEHIFSLDEVATLLVHGSTATVTRKDKAHPDWRPLAIEVGRLMRETLQGDNPVIGDEVIKQIPPEETIRLDIQKVIDTEVNPGVAGHGGRITLTKVEGNSVTIEMGGGCQGCSAADLTLKQGIHSAFRKAVPFVGAIYDETDHAAGQNPFYS